MHRPSRQYPFASPRRRRGRLGSHAALPLLFAVAGCSNFHVVEPGQLYRVAQLDKDSVAAIIREHGIQTVLKLNGGAAGHANYDASYEPTVEAGIDFVHVPMSALSLPSKDTLLQLWEAFGSARYPILVHCRAGADRTGLASAIYMLRRATDAEGSLKPFRAAMRQLHPFPYLHLGWGRADAMDRVLEQFEPYAGAIDFGTWVQRYYDPTR